MRCGAYTGMVLRAAGTASSAPVLGALLSTLAAFFVYGNSVLAQANGFEQHMEAARQSGVESWTISVPQGQSHPTVPTIQ